MSEIRDDEIQLSLPWPPSMNAYWCLRFAGGQRILVVSPSGTKFQKLVRALTCMRWRRPPIEYQCSVLIEAWAPNRREWDVDNRIKPTLDALAKAGVLTNDKLVRDVRIVDRGISPPGRLVVSIRRFSGGTYGTEAEQQQCGAEREKDASEALADPAQARGQGDRAMVDLGASDRGDGAGQAVRTPGRV